MDARDSVRGRPLAWKAYRVLWSVIAGIVFTVGALTACLTLPPAAVAGMFLAVALPTGGLAWACCNVDLMPRRLILPAAAMGGVVVLAGQGLTWIFGGWSLLVLTAVCLGTPALLEWAAARTVAWHRARHPEPVATGGDALDGLVAHDLQFDDPRACRLLDPAASPARLPTLVDLTTDDLGRLWKVSGKWMDRGLGPSDVGHLVHLRSGCLDELERRDPSGFKRWIAAGRPCSTEPARFITSGRSAPPSELG